jgi:3-oxoacyl-[acyl-carrier protein] reductase
LVAKAEEAAGAPLDILIANAGITRDGLLLRMKDEDWETVIKVNLEAYFRLSRAALKGMMKRRSGRIIGITSVVGVTGNPGQTNYAASKAGVHRLTESLAEELKATPVTVNAVLPSIIDTPANRKDMPDADPSTWVAPADLAEVILFLASPASRAVTGALVPVTGRV